MYCKYAPCYVTINKGIFLPMVAGVCRMLQRRQYNKAFSIVEMLIAVALVTCLSAVSYRILKSATKSQLSSVESQKANSLSQVALDRFKSDVSLIDYNWVRFGVASVYPHQGYEFGSNYYTDDTISQTEELNDGVTFLRRDPFSDRVYEFSTQKRICYPEAPSATLDLSLFEDMMKLNSVEGLKKDDWVLIYQAGHYMLGVVKSVGVAGVKLREPNDLEKQQTSQNNAGKSNGYVIQPGVVMASLDYDGSATTTTEDDGFCFDSSTSRMQKIGSPVSYFVDYRTNDSKEKSLTNTYVLNDRGEKEKMLVRTEYVGGEVEREYVSKIDSVGFMYDLLGEQNVNGTTGEIVRNVGRDKNSSELLDLSHSVDESNQFQNTYRIIAMKINITVASQDQKTGGQGWKQTKELKVAFDPSFSDESYQDSTTVVSSLTDTLTTLEGPSGVTLTEELGKPLYFVNGDSEEVIVPVSKFQVAADGTMGDQSSGEIYVYDKHGCSVNADSGCDPSENNSVIKFNLGTGVKFFPNTLVQTALADGTQRILVGGVGMQTVGSVISRKSVLGVIDVEPGTTLAEKLQNPVSGGCNIAGCALQEINTSLPETEGLVDTANISVDTKNPGTIYISSVTKKEGESSPAKIYKGIWNGSIYSYSQFGEVPGTDQSRLVSSISDKMITIAGSQWLAACTTKKISESCDGPCLTKENGAVPPKSSFTVGASGAISMAELPFGGGSMTVVGTSGSGSTSGSSSSGGSSGYTVPDFEDLGTMTGSSMGGSSGGSSGTVTSEEDAYGAIVLVARDAANPDVLKKVQLRQHNYMCPSMGVDKSGNLIISGRLTAQPISYLEMQRAVTDSVFQAQIAQQIMYLDEIGNVDEENSYFADYYRVDPDTYEDPTNPQYIGWQTGASTVEFPDGTFGMVNANKFRLAAGFGLNTSGSAKEFSNAGIAQISLAGMQDRVVASIVTDPTNFNNSSITTTYALRSTDLPSVYIPGTFYMNTNADGTGARTDPTPLPAISPSMSDSSWITMYQQFLSSHSANGLNTEMPVLGDNTVEVEHCENSFPSTCK